MAAYHTMNLDDETFERVRGLAHEQKKKMTQLVREWSKMAEKAWREAQ